MGHGHAQHVALGQGQRRHGATQFLNREGAAQQGIQGLVGIALFGIHEDPSGTVAEFDPKTDCKHVSHVRVDACDVFVSRILGCGFGDSAFAFSLGILATCRGNLGEPLEVSRQANAELQDLQFDIFLNDRTCDAA